VKPRKPLAILAATAITGFGLTALATPASADTTVTISGNWTYDNSDKLWKGGSVSTFQVNDAALTIQVAQGTRFDGFEVNFLTASDANLNPPGGDNKISFTSTLISGNRYEVDQTTTSGAFGIKEGTQGGTVTLATNNGIPLAVLIVTYNATPEPDPDPDPTPDSGSGGSSAAPTTVDVTLDQITSEVLRTWASTATLGSWKELPESSEIIGVDENAGKTFLGAATTPDFPVEIAQRQVDNGWGAYETFNDNGDLTSVFIPAGGWMAISNSTRLYAIWGD